MSQILKVTDIRQKALKQFFMHLKKQSLYELLQSKIDSKTQNLDHHKHKFVKNILTLLSDKEEVIISINDNGYRTMSPSDFHKIASLIDSPKSERLFNIFCGGFNIPEVATDCGISRQALHEQYINFLNYAYAYNKTSRWLRSLPTPTA